MEIVIRGDKIKVTQAINGRIMNKNVFVFFVFNKSITFFVVEPLNTAFHFTHTPHLPICLNSQRAQANQ